MKKTRENSPLGREEEVDTSLEGTVEKGAIVGHTALGAIEATGVAIVVTTKKTMATTLKTTS